jgi:hypothetical protein
MHHFTAFRSISSDFIEIEPLPPRTEMQQNKTISFQENKCTAFILLHRL